MPGVEDGRFAHRLPEMLRLSREYAQRQYDERAIRECQTVRLATCLTDALRSVPRYRELHISDDDVARDPWKALRAFPVLEKSSLRDALSDAVADDFDPERCFRVVTSGSTGVPLVLLHDEESHVHEAACFHRVLESVGYVSGERVCRVYCDASRPAWGVTAQFLPGLMELAAVNLQEADPRAVAARLTRLQAWNPVGLFGNPSDLLLLARCLEAYGLALDDVRFIVSAGETLTPNVRIALSRTFRGASIRDVYSMQESRSVAWACEHGALHVNDDRVIVESWSSAGRDELLITPLMNRSMPLIRYRTGDLGRYIPWSDASCTCGRRLGRLEAFGGRERGFVVLTDGRIVGPKPIKQLLTSQPVASWQLIQRSPERLEILLLAGSAGPVPNIVDTVRREVTAMLDDGTTVDVRWVAERELLTGTAKFQMMHLTCSPTISAQHDS